MTQIRRECPLLNVKIVGETSDQIAVLLERHDTELAVGRLTAPLQHDVCDFHSQCRGKLVDLRHPAVAAIDRRGSVVSESVVRDHVKARLLRTLPLSVGRELKGFGVLTRKGEQLSEPAEVFVKHLDDVTGRRGGGV